jgi:hypothetical protein
MPQPHHVGVTETTTFNRLAFFYDTRPAGKLALLLDVNREQILSWFSFV